MNSNLFWIICIGMFSIGVICNILAWILKKVYKKKMNSMARDRDIAEK